MKLLAIISHKGGSGKTSSAVMLAEEFARLGLKVLLVDADRQRGSGLLLGIDQPTGNVQSTRTPRLRYLCGTEFALQELPARVAELGDRFDLAVVDTPSLDDRLAKSWLQLSTGALLVLPVEPLSVWTLAGAEGELAELRSQNPELKLLGILPTMYDDAHERQAQILRELTEARPGQVLSPAVHWDANLAQRGAQRDHRTAVPSERTCAAYRAIGESLLRGMSVEVRRRRAPAATLAAPQPESIRTGAGSGHRLSGIPRWAVTAAVAVLLMTFGLVWLLQARGSVRGAPRPAEMTVRERSSSGVTRGE